MRGWLRRRGWVSSPLPFLIHIRAATLAVTAIVFDAKQWFGYAAANVALAATYALVGVVIGPLFGCVAGVLIAFLVPFLDLGIAQSPMLRPSPEPWGAGPARLRLGSGPVRHRPHRPLRRDRTSAGRTGVVRRAHCCCDICAHAQPPDVILTQMTGGEASSVSRRESVRVRSELAGAIERTEEIIGAGVVQPPGRSGGVDPHPAHRIDVMVIDACADQLVHLDRCCDVVQRDWAKSPYRQPVRRSRVGHGTGEEYLPASGPCGDSGSDVHGGAEDVAGTFNHRPVVKSST